MQILGISASNAFSQKTFADSLKLPYPLLSDAPDLKVANSFAIPSGLFSHWQVWLGAAAGLQLCSRVLNRYGKGGDAATS